MKILAFIGSLRKESYNSQLAHTIAERYRDRFEMEFAEIGDVPLFNQDEEMNAPPSVLKLREQVKAADAVLIVTPEYNWSVPGVLKNALDWLSRVEKVLIGKPAMIAGVSTGAMGTLRAQLHLREILAGLQVKLLPPAGNELLVGQAAQKFDAASGKLTDEATLQHLDAVVGRFVEFVASVNR
ncbi:NADPH-dependent FMN reductase [Cohnella caldifontis]|uniref:NADPH-dependent FMN reductase n=1 Tax=Cohnella caldifontis TaxID=3027471 RepID=UPI0023EA8CC7|nr:NADPH-dependent FMN reductase [Cohnella sp. YIM B05605]